MAVAIGPLSIDMYLPAMPAIQQALGTDARRVQATMAVYLVGLALGQLLYGPVSDAHGRKPPLLFGLGLYVVAATGCALAPTIDWLIGWRFLQALGASSAAVTVRAMIRDRHEPQDVARALSLLTGIMGAAPIIAPSLGSLLFVHFGWRAIFAVLAVFAAATALTIATSIPETRPDHSGVLAVDTVRRTVRRLLRHRRFRAHAVAGALTQSGLFAYVSTAALAMSAGFGRSVGEIGMLFSLSATSYVLGAQINRRLLIRHSADDLLRRGLRAHAAASLLLVVVAGTGWGGLPAAMGCIALGLAAMGVSSPNAVALALGPIRRHAGTAASMMGTLQFSVAAMTSFALGHFTQASLLPLGCAWTLAAALAWLSLRGMHRTHSR